MDNIAAGVDAQIHEQCADEEGQGVNVREAVPGLFLDNLVSGVCVTLWSFLLVVLFPVFTGVVDEHSGACHPNRGLVVHKSNLAALVYLTSWIAR